MSSFLVNSIVIVIAEEHTMFAKLNGSKGVIISVGEEVALVEFGPDDQVAIPLEFLKDFYPIP